MNREQKLAIIDFISKNDPNGELVRQISPSDDFTSGRISYNTNSVRLYRAISELKDEEYVRAYLLVFLVRKLGFSPSPSIIEFEHEYSIGRPSSRNARIDIIVRYPQDWPDVNNRGRVFLYIECKAPDEFDNDKRYIKGQLFDLSRQETPFPKYGVYYTTRVENGSILDRLLIIDFDEFPTFERWDEQGQPANDLLPQGYGLPERIRFANVELPTQTQRPLRTDVTSAEFERLRHELHNIVWGGGGTNNNDVFVMLVRLFLCRIYDELETAPGSDFRFQRHAKPDGSLESPDEIVARISRLFNEAAASYLGYSETEISETVPFERRKISPAKVAYVIEQLQSISFIRNTSRGEGDILGEFFEKIVAQDFTQTKGQFFTHTNIVRFCTEIVRLGESAKNTFLHERDEQGRPRLPYIIDPSAGSGTFLIESMKAVTKQLSSLTGTNLPRRQREFAQLWFGETSPNYWARDYIYGIEPNADLGLATKVNMILHGDGSTNIFVSSGLLPFADYALNLRSHVLSATIGDPDHPYNRTLNEQFDFIFTNPPFSVSIPEEEKRRLEQSFVLDPNANSEYLFIERWYQLLREGGKVVAVLPESVLDTSSALSIRLFIFQHFWIEAVIALPYVAFKPFTSTKTSILVLKKKSKFEVESWKSAWRTEQDTYSRAIRDIRSSQGRRISAGASVLIGREVTLTNGELPEDIASQVEAIRNNGDAWIFKRVLNNPEFDYRIFMAEPEHVGYKRRKGLEDLITPDDLMGPGVEGNSVLNSYRGGLSDTGSRRFGFWVQFSKVGERPDLRFDPKYQYLWSFREGKVFETYSGPQVRVGELLVPAERNKVAKGSLEEPRGLVDLADVEARTSILLNVTETDELGSDKLEFGDADLAISRLEPYLGKVLKNDPSQRWIGSTEWLLYNLSNTVRDADYVRYLLLLPEMLEAYRCLQSGKRHARFAEIDFLDLLVPHISPDNQTKLADFARNKERQILEFRRNEEDARNNIDSEYLSIITNH